MPWSSPTTDGARHCEADPALALGLNTHDGQIIYGPVAEAFGSQHVTLEDVLR